MGEEDEGLFKREMGICGPVIWLFSVLSLNSSGQQSSPN